MSQRSCAVSQGASALYCDTKGCPHPRYKICIVTHPQQPGHARARCRSPHVQAGRVVVVSRRVVGRVATSCWPCRDELLAVSRLAMRPPVRLCHNTACCIMTQTQKTGSSPFQPLMSFFFLFSLIIFFLF